MGILVDDGSGDGSEVVEAGTLGTVTPTAVLYDPRLGNANGCDPAGCTAALTRVRTCGMVKIFLENTPCPYSVALRVYVVAEPSLPPSASSRLLVSHATFHIIPPPTPRLYTTSPHLTRRRLPRFLSLTPPRHIHLLLSPPQDGDVSEGSRWSCASTLGGTCSISYDLGAVRDLSELRLGE